MEWEIVTKNTKRMSLHVSKYDDMVCVGLSGDALYESSGACYKDINEAIQDIDAAIDTLLKARNKLHEPRRCKFCGILLE